MHAGWMRESGDLFAMLLASQRWQQAAEVQQQRLQRLLPAAERNIFDISAMEQLADVRALPAACPGRMHGMPYSHMLSCGLQCLFRAHPRNFAILACMQLMQPAVVRPACMLSADQFSHHRPQRVWVCARHCTWQAKLQRRGPSCRSASACSPCVCLGPPSGPLP